MLNIYFTNELGQLIETKEIQCGCWIHLISPTEQDTHDDVNGAFYDTIPLGIIITEKHFVTICLKDNPLFDEFIENKVKQFFTFKKTRFALQMLYMIATYYLKYLKQISKKTDAIEAELHQSMKNKELFYLLNLEKSLVYLWPD